MRNISKALFIIALTSAPGLALAQGDPEPVGDGTPGGDAGDGTPGTTAAPSPTDELPKPQSDDDVQPEVAAAGVPSGGIVRQAGVGGLIGYGRAGVLEIGGSVGFTFATDYRDINVSPSIGWFLADNFEISAILSVTNIKSGDSDSETLASVLLEPSYHIPFNRTTFGFLGLGVGAAHVSAYGTGFAVAPRVGANFMVGRSGVLTPSISYEYTTINTEIEGLDPDVMVTVVALSSAVRFNVGFTAMW